jgi:hypothetical protein
MKLWKFLLGSALSATFAVQPALAVGPGGKIVEVVTFKLKAGVAPAEFAPIDKAVEREHVAKQPGFMSRESAHGATPRSHRRAASLWKRRCQNWWTSITGDFHSTRTVFPPPDPGADGCPGHL